MKTTEERFEDLEIMVMSQEKKLEDLNQEVIRQSLLLQKLLLEHKSIIQTLLKDSQIKKQSEETPPPHY
ncbi:MAG: SlyX family protein [Alphaproteobacteria bacterium]|nr:SlyX family protein [Alphaproteobacteria bacterium]